MRHLSSLTATFLVALFAMASVPTKAAQSPNGKSFYGSFGIGDVATQDTQWEREGAGTSEVVEAADKSTETTTTFNVYDISADVGIIITGALGYWLNDIQRVEIGLGYRSYKIEGKSHRNISVITDTNGDGEFNTDDGDTVVNSIEYINNKTDIDVMPLTLNSYFYPFMTLLPDNHHIYFGGGLGIGFWSFDNDYGDGDDRIAFMVNADIGYEFYLKGLADSGILPREFDNVIVGFGYQFSWSNPKFDFSDGEGDENFRTFVNDELRQKNHSFLWNVRYEF